MSTLFDSLVRTWSVRQPKSAALEIDSHAISYEDLERLVLELSGVLAQELRPGDRVLVFFPSSLEYVVSLLAVTAAGGVAVAAPWSAGPDRLRYVVESMRPRLCLHDGARSIDGVECRRVSLDTRNARFTSPSVEGAADRVQGRGDVALILFSSGSTGRPKGVVLEHRNLIAAARNLSSVFRLGTENRELAVAPMFHSDGWQRVSATLFGGGTLVVSRSALSAGGGFEQLSSLDISGCFLPTPMLRLLLRSSPEAVRSALRTVRSLELGSTPIAAEELRFLAESVPECRIYFHFGLTECSRATILDVCAHPAKLATVGQPSPGVEIRIGDCEDAPVGIGEVGQVLLRGPQRSSRYWDRPDLDREKFSDGWFRTGDYGALDADGFLTLYGRRDDMVTSAGYHFFPAEVETELGPVPGVVDYIVAGVSGRAGFLEQLLWAFVVPADPSEWRPHEFLARARERLPSHMLPRRVVPVPDLPRTASGKPNRAEAVRLYAREPPR